MLPPLDEYRRFRADLRKYYLIECGAEAPPWRRRLKLWALNLGFHCVAVYRLGRFCRAALESGFWPILPCLLLYEALAFLMRFFHHVDIFAADIGPGLYLGHVGTIYVGRCRVGANFSLTHNVTIGLGSSGTGHGLPELGDNVWIGSGSTLFGRIRIGDGVAINCGTVLSRSLPARCLAGGNPGRVILASYDNAPLFAGYAVPTLGPAPDSRAAALPRAASDGKLPAVERFRIPPRGVGFHAANAQE